MVVIGHRSLLGEAHASAQARAVVVGRQLGVDGLAGCCRCRRVRPDVRATSTPTVLLPTRHLHLVGIDVAGVGGGAGDALRDHAVVDDGGRAVGAGDRDVHDARGRTTGRSGRAR